jgi:hypothetical protein
VGVEASCVRVNGLHVRVRVKDVKASRVRVSVGILRGRRGVLRTCKGLHVRVRVEDVKASCMRVSVKACVRCTDRGCARGVQWEGYRRHACGCRARARRG